MRYCKSHRLTGHNDQLVAIYKMCIQKYVGTNSDLDDHGPNKINEGIITIEQFQICSI